MNFDQNDILQMRSNYDSQRSNHKNELSPKNHDQNNRDITKLLIKKLTQENQSIKSVSKQRQLKIDDLMYQNQYYQSQCQYLKVENSNLIKDMNYLKTVFNRIDQFLNANIFKKKPQLKIKFQEIIDNNSNDRTIDMNYSHSSQSSRNNHQQEIIENLIEIENLNNQIQDANISNKQQQIQINAQNQLIEQFKKQNQQLQIRLQSVQEENEKFKQIDLIRQSLDLQQLQQIDQDENKQSFQEIENNLFNDLKSTIKKQGNYQQLEINYESYQTNSQCVSNYNTLQKFSQTFKKQTKPFYRKLNTIKQLDNSKYHSKKVQKIIEANYQIFQNMYENQILTNQHQIDQLRLRIKQRQKQYQLFENEIQNDLQNFISNQSKSYNQNEIIHDHLQKNINIMDKNQLNQNTNSYKVISNQNRIKQLRNRISQEYLNKLITHKNDQNQIQMHKSSQKEKNQGQNTLKQPKSIEQITKKNFLQFKHMYQNKIITNKKQLDEIRKRIRMRKSHYQMISMIDLNKTTQLQEQTSFFKIKET